VIHGPGALIHKASSKTMRNIGRAGLIVVLAVLADGTAALAQGFAYYNRLSDLRQDPAPLSSQGMRVARGANPKVTRAARQAVQRSTSITEPTAGAEQALGTARSGPNTAVTRTGYEASQFRPFSAEYSVQAQARPSNIPAGSTWEQQPQQLERPQQPPPVIATSQRHDYYPNMRTAMTPQAPVTLTASRISFYPGCHCTPSRSMALAGGGHHR
jgi:hypothetical protein